MSEPLHGPGQRRATLKWTLNMRLTLHLMAEEFGIAIYSERAATVFGIIFDEHIHDCGLYTASAGALRSQYGERVLAARTHNWLKILHPPNTAEEATRRRQIRDSIANAIQQSNGENRGHAMTQSNAMVATPKPAPRQNLSKGVSVAASVPISPQISPPPPPRRGRGRPRKVAMVVIPPPDRNRAPRLPPTPSETPPIGMQVHRRHGTILNISDSALAKLPYPQSWTPPSDEQVHVKMLPPVLFRFWCKDQKHCYNSSDRFISGRFATSNVPSPPPPAVNQIHAADIFHHVEGQPVATPFISTSSCLIWSVKNGIKEMKKGRDINMGLISTADLDPASVYYARPFIQSIKAFRPFTKGKWAYSGSNEFFVWDEIPKKAIIHSFSLNQFLNMASDSIGISQVIRPKFLERTPDLRLRNELLSSRQPMNELLAASCADVVQYMGLNASSSAEHIQGLVAELVSGWMIDIEHRTNPEWTDLAAVFAHAFSIQSIRPLNLRDTEALMLSFLLGISRGLKASDDKNVAVQGLPASLQKLRKKAVAIGLDNPAGLLRGELDAAKIHLMVQQKSYDRRYLPAASQLTLQDELDVEMADDGDNESMEVFDFDENGMIV